MVQFAELDASEVIRLLDKSQYGNAGWRRQTHLVVVDFNLLLCRRLKYVKLLIVCSLSCWG